MQQRKALGRGIDALFQTTETATESSIIATTVAGQTTGERLRTVPVNSIVPNRLQPRKVFNDEKIAELANSIKEQGIIQPLIVTQSSSGHYELIAGERRLRASKLAGLTEVPVVIKNVDTEGMLELSLIENLQREDLNPIEAATAIKELIDQFGYTQDEAAKKLGSSRVAVTNSLRLLNLPKVIQDDVSSGRMSPGHARALLALNSLQDQLRLRERVLSSELTVRDVEKMIQNVKARPTKKRQGDALTPQMKFILDEITKTLATKVKLAPNGKGQGGDIIIEYYTAKDLDRIYNKIIGNG